MTGLSKTKNNIFLYGFPHLYKTFFGLHGGNPTKKSKFWVARHFKFKFTTDNMYLKTNSELWEAAIFFTAPTPFFFLKRLPLLIFFLKRLRLLKSFFQRLRLLHKLTNRLLLWILVKFSKIFFRFTYVNYKKYNKPRTRVQAYQMWYKSIMWTDERVCTFVHFYIFKNGYVYVKMEVCRNGEKYKAVLKIRTFI